MISFVSREIFIQIKLNRASSSNQSQYDIILFIARYVWAFFMATGPEITEQQLDQAVANYTDCLALPNSSQVLVVTDKLPKDSTQPVDQDLLLRNRMAAMLIRRIGQQFPVHGLWTDGRTKEELHDRTVVALKSLDSWVPKGAADGKVTTVIYMAAGWENRDGIYTAVDEFAENKAPGLVRVAGSRDFSTGDCRVMSNMDGKRRQAVTDASEYYKKFIKANPKGRLEILTKYGEIPYQLWVNYDTEQSPFETELGRFDKDNQVFDGNYVYVNIPGGEIFATPYPYERSFGTFSAEGVIYSVREGLIVSVQERTDGPILQESSESLIRVIREGGRPPLAEFGLGLYELAGIKTYEDSSVLSKEKERPHIGAGHGFNSTQAEEIAKAAGSFLHTDVVLDNPTILFNDQKGNRIQFYPLQAA